MKVIVPHRIDMNCTLINKFKVTRTMLGHMNNAWLVSYVVIVGDFLQSSELHSGHWLHELAHSQEIRWKVMSCVIVQPRSLSTFTGIFCHHCL